MTSFRTTRRMPFTARQMYALVADVERYPEFLPMCEALVVRKRGEEAGLARIVADMTVGYGALRETFTTCVTLDPERLVVHAGNVPEYSSGPFRMIDNTWGFRDAPGGCDVDFAIAYEFNSFMLQMLVGNLFERVFRRYTQAFEERAAKIYGSTPA